jgi:pimeloyl-ACP methyl ester carboxylesterase
MSAMREGSVLCVDPHGFHRMRYVEWGEAGNPRVLVCVHGLTRNGRDFDELARAMADAYRVVCPDVAGRGRSDWLRDAKDYTYALYGTDMATLLAKIGAESVDWLGTSMGGILGMIIASVPGTPVRKLVLNDVGAVIPKASLQRLAIYVGREPAFESLEALEAAMRSVSPFGNLSAAQWRHLATHISYRSEDGQWRVRYDPGVAVNLSAAVTGDVDLRGFWNAIRGEALVLRGAQSDLLLPETLEEMRGRPGTQVHIVPDTGHAPMLMDPDQISVVRRFLLA